MVESRSVGRKVQILTENYCANSSIHGIKYVVWKRNNSCTILWWTAALVLSTYGCGRLIHSAYQKWDQSPVIVTFNEKSTPVWQIPFPAITICPETKAKSAFLNFTKFFNQYAPAESLLSSQMHDPGNRTVGRGGPAPVNPGKVVGLTMPGLPTAPPDPEYERFLAVAQVCNPTLFSDLGQKFGDSCVDLLRSSSITREEMFRMCRWRNSDIDCSALFVETLTEEGPCFTFNAIAADTLLRGEELHTDYDYMMENKSTPEWSLEEGYHENATIDTYPVRVLGAGPRAGLKVLLRLNDADLDYVCKGPVPGFRMLLHSPSEYPQVSKQYYMIPLDQEVLIMLKPQMITTTEGLRDYHPHRRQCYFNDERHLRFFKVYTQQNCELECTANYTKRICGCVRFSMPRDNITYICGAGRIRCYNDAEDTLLAQAVKPAVIKNSNNNHWANCDCLPACTSIQYDAEISQAQHNSRILDRSINSSMAPGTRMAQLTIYFKESQFVPSRRGEMYGVTDFLANCGGLLGLFMGFSLLSIVEIVYFCLIQPLSSLWGSMRGRNKVTKVASPPPRTSSLVDGQTYRVLCE